MGAVGGADLAQHRAGAGHDVGNAEGAADLDQFAARDRHLAPERQRVEDQQHRGGVVVDHGGRLGAGDLAQQAGDVFVALAAPPGGEVEFQRGGGGKRLRGGGGGGRRQRCAAEIGVQHGAGQVEHRALRGGEASGQCVGCRIQDVGAGGAGKAAPRAAPPARPAVPRSVACRPNRASSTAAAGDAQQRIERGQRTGGGWHGGAMLRRMTTTFEIPAMRTERLVLRAFRAADIDALAAMEAEPEVRRFLGGNLLSRDRGMGNDGAADSDNGRCADMACSPSSVDGRLFVGWAGVLHPLEWPEPELAYSLDQPFWGRGLAIEAARAARGWAFAQHRLPSPGEFHHAGEPAFGPRGGKTGCGARGNGGIARLSGGMVGASGTRREAPTCLTT